MKKAAIAVVLAAARQLVRRIDAATDAPDGPFEAIVDSNWLNNHRPIREASAQLDAAIVALSRAEVFDSGKD